MTKGLFDQGNMQLWQRQVEQMLLKAEADIVNLLRNQMQRPNEWMGKLPHLEDAFEGVTDPGSTQPGRIIEGKLDADLGPATSGGDGETTATLSVYMGAGADWADTTEDVTVTNRHVHFEAKSGDLLIAIELESGEIRPLATMPGFTCLSKILSFELDGLSTDSAPAHVLGVSSGGCMVRVPVEEC